MYVLGGGVKSTSGHVFWEHICPYDVTEQIEVGKIAVVRFYHAKLL